MDVYAFIRFFKEEKIIVILNNSDSDYIVDIPTWEHLPDKTKLCCLINKGSFTVKEKRLKGPDLLPRSGVILLVRG